MSAVSANEIESGNPRFPLMGHVAYRVVRSGDRVEVRFGEFPTGFKVVFGGVVLGALASGVVMANFEIPAMIAILPLICVVGCFALYFLRQKEIQTTVLDLERGRCNFKVGSRMVEVLDGIDEVRVINSHRFRDGGVATEGVCEVFLKLGNNRYYPIIHGPSYGEFDKLAQTIADGTGAKLEIQNRR